MYRLDSMDLLSEGSLLIEHANCVGNSKVSFIEDPSHLEDKISSLSIVEQHNYGKDYVYL